MTAEIAILNKTAVALAADSAVTISAGSSQEKIFDSGDKLFELSCHDSIGVMINNDMNFMEAPIPVLVKDYRSRCPRFETVEQAASGFLKYLQEFGASAPEPVRLRQVARQVRPLVSWLNTRCGTEIQKCFDELIEQGDMDAFLRSRSQIIASELDFLKLVMERSEKSDFIDGRTPSLSDADAAIIKEIVNAEFDFADESQRENLIKIIISSASKLWPSQSATGIVVAGFGGNELFPTLQAYEVFGMVGGVLKYKRTQDVDIDRNGHRAKVIPFAQREMVERFLYGLDSDIERKIRQFCQRTVSDISERILSQFELSETDAKELLADAREAEAAFLDGLKEGGFDAIRSDSQFEIEDMVEFMPKPEMARMAEALVNLTSIKRRVSRGMETVGGPIDVAVISKAEGFVWVKRKFYFPPELNHRYLDRMESRVRQPSGEQP